MLSIGTVGKGCVAIPQEGGSLPDIDLPPSVDVPAAMRVRPLVARWSPVRVGDNLAHCADESVYGFAASAPTSTGTSQSVSNSSRSNSSSRNLALKLSI
jgi:hypothetical protein